MSMDTLRVGFAVCGSFCTLRRAMGALEAVKTAFGDVTPIASEITASTDTRFGRADEFMQEMERICGRPVIQTIHAAEPIGPRKMLDVLVITPCTGNTLSKLAHGTADSSVTLAAKAHLRNGRPLVLAVSTNDGLAAAARNIGDLLCRRNVYFVPFRQDDPVEKPTSLVAEFGLVVDTVRAAMEGRQIQPVLLGPQADTKSC